MPTLRNKTIKGIFWSLLQNVGGKGITFFVTIILAHLLTPEIFGLIGMLMIFIHVSQTLVVAGFSQALIQKKDADEEDYSSVFWINLVISLLLYITIFVCAPLIANFYDQPILTDLARVLSLIFVINAFSYVQEARLSKEMQFKTLTIVSIPSMIIGGMVGVSMARLGHGVWSIIATQLVTRFAYTVQIWLYSKWQPLFVYNAVKIKALFSFGSKLMVSNMIDAVFQNIYMVVIGKFFPISAVGYYQNANNLVRTPSSTISGALSKVAFPAFSSIQDDDKRLREGFKKIIQQALFWLCPVFVLTGVLAEPLFRFVFGDKWLPAVPFFQIICIVGIFLPLHQYNLSIINVKGRSDLFLKLEVIKKVFVVIGLIVTVPIGIYALLLFQAISSILMYFVNGYFSGKYISYPVIEQVKDIVPIFSLSAFIGVVVYILDMQIANVPDFTRLLAGFLVGSALYWFMAKQFKLAPYTELKSIVRGKLNFKRLHI